MKPSEATIAAAIDELGGKAGLFEKLAGRWICAAPEFEGRFSALQIKGRKRDQTVRGWPDAFAEAPDGSWDCVQVTHSDEWRGKVREDVEKVREHRVSGYVMVAWAHGPKSQDELNGFRDELAEAGAPRDAIDFVFKGRLLDSLQDWRFAHLWREVLGIAPDVRPFRPVDFARGLIGIDAGSEAFQPRAAEFREGLVHRPAVLDTVVEHLERVGIAEVRGRGAAGKTVLAEHVAHWHLSKGAPRVVDESDHGEEEPISAGPVYYVKLGSFEEGGDGPADAFRQQAAENALFIVDDVHLNAHAALNLLNEWEDESRGSKMLRLGREQHVYAYESSSGLSRPEPRVPELKLVVGPDDLVGVYRRLARLAGEEDPEIPPGDVVRDWLDLFRGDLVVFSVAVAARLRRLLRGEWELTESDASLEVKERYLDRGLDAEERQDLLGLATLAGFELGAPAPAVRSGFVGSKRTGAVLQVQTGPEDSGEFQLAHAGLGRLLLAAGGGTAEARDANEWAGADTAFALRLAAARWGVGENAGTGEALRLAIAAADGLGSALLSVPGSIGSTAVEALDALDLLPWDALDRQLLGESEEILASLLDRPDRLAPAMQVLGEPCPVTAERLAAALSEQPSLDLLIEHVRRLPSGGGRQLGAWVKAVPGLDLAIGARFADVDALTGFLVEARDLPGILGSKGMRHVMRKSPNPRETVGEMLRRRPELAEVLARRVLAGDLVRARRGCELLWDLHTGFADEVRRFALDSAYEDRVVAEMEGIALTELVSAIRFLHAVDPGLLGAVEARIPEEERRRLANRLRGEPESLRGIAYSRNISPLLADLTAEVEALGSAVPARSRPRTRNRDSLSAPWWQLEQDPEQALYLDLNSVLGFVISEHDEQRTRLAAAEVVRVLRAEGNRDRIVRTAAVLPPAELCTFLIWAGSLAPELEQDLLEHLQEASHLASLADSCVDYGVFEHLAGLLDALEERVPALVDRLVDLCIAPDRLHRLTEEGLRSHPTGWVALLRREAVAVAVLDDLEPSRWRHYWRDCPLGGIQWYRSLLLALRDHGRADLCADPTSRLLEDATAADWNEAITLAHLAQVLETDQAADQELALEFLERIDYRAFLKRNYEAGSVWAIAHFLNRVRRGPAKTVGSGLGELVADAVVNDPLAERVRREVARGWSGRSPADTGGLLALIGALRLVGVPVFMELPPAFQVLEALELAVQDDGPLTASHVLLCIGLRTLVSESGVAWRVDDGTVLARYLEIFEAAEPPTEDSRELNAELAAWIERGLESDGLLPA